MTMPTLDPAVRLTVHGVLSALFLWAAVHKLRDMPSFRTALANYELLPQRCVAPCAALLVATELGVAVTLWLPRLAAPAAVAAAGLLALYAGAIIVNLARGRRHIDCGCAGTARHQPLSSGLAARNAALVVVALVSALPAASRPLTWIDGATVAFGTVTLIFLYAAVDGLMANAPQMAALSGAGERNDSGHRHEAAHA